MLRVVLAVAFFAFTVYCVVDAVKSDKDEVRRLPKWLWVTLTIITTPLGGIAWLLLGRPRPEGGKGGRLGPLGPDDDPDFLRGI